MKYTIKKLQQGGPTPLAPKKSVDDTATINLFKASPQYQTDFAKYSGVPNASALATDTKPGPVHEQFKKYIQNMLPPTVLRADSLSYLSPAQPHNIIKTNTIDFAKKYPNKTLQDLGAQRTGLSNLSSYKNVQGQPITQNQYQLDLSQFNNLKKLFPHK